MTTAIRLLGLLLCLSLAPTLHAQTPDPQGKTAQRALHRFLIGVLEVWGLPARFELVYSRELDSVRALPEHTPPLLAFNPDWITSIQPAGADTLNWIHYAEATHQIAHLQMGHSSRDANSEAQADWYTGFILGVKGADLDDALAFRNPTEALDENEQKNLTQRMEIIANGWQRGRQQERLRAEGLAPYLLADSGHEPIDGKTLESLDPEQLKLARNEIFARHGYRFKDRELERYFRKQLWYLPRDQEVKLSEQERANVALIRQHEQRRDATKAQPAPVASAPKAHGKGDYLYPDSHQRRLTAAELAPFNARELRLIRNEIFARHGYRFNATDLQRYFGQQSWYRPHRDQVDLSRVEAANVKLIRSLEP